MRLKYKDKEYEAVRPDSREMRTSDLAALQRETRWKMPEVQEMGRLEAVALQMVTFFTLRSRAGLAISFAKAGDLLDEVEFIPDEDELAQFEAAQAEGAEEVPTSAPTDSGRGDDAAPESEPS